MYELIAANKRRSVLLIAGFVVLVGLVGAAVGVLIGYGVAGTLAALVFSGLVAFGSYWKADAIALVASRARPADPDHYQRLHNLVEGLCIAQRPAQAAGLHHRRPGAERLRDGPELEARGDRGHHGSARMMSRAEPKAWWPTSCRTSATTTSLVSTLAVTMVGRIAILTDVTIRMSGGTAARPVVTEIIETGTIRSPSSGSPCSSWRRCSLGSCRPPSAAGEELADVSASMTRYPPGLISALEKLQADSTVTHLASRATAHLWIEQPMPGVREGGRLGRVNRLFDTHPPLKNGLRCCGSCDRLMFNRQTLRRALIAGGLAVLGACSWRRPEAAADLRSGHHHPVVDHDDHDVDDHHRRFHHDRRMTTTTVALDPVWPLDRPGCRTTR
ncbi:MAG: zinc metalloprotease HtpX [Ilumatobacteraceae bacterium]